MMIDGGRMKLLRELTGKYPKKKMVGNDVFTIIIRCLK